MKKKNPTIPTDNVTGTMDFCYDLIDLLDKLNYKYIAIFIVGTQTKTEICNKVTVSHGDFEKKDYKWIKKLPEIMPTLLDVKTVRSESAKINQALKAVRTQPINYLLILMAPEENDVEFVFDIKTRNIYNATLIALQLLVKEIKKFF